MVWTSLSLTTQEEIVKRLDEGESPYLIADDYGLNSSSLARKYRRIKQKRNLKKLSATKTEETPKTQQTTIQPKIQTLFHKSTDLFDLTVLGAADAFPQERNAWLNTKSPLSILFYTDTHFNQNDEGACDAFIKIAATIKHDLIIHGGDALECYGLSRYGKDVRRVFTNSFRNEINSWRSFSGKLQYVTDAPKMMIFGNHMQRYYDWLMQPSNQSLLEMEEMQLDRIMRLSEFGYAPMVNSIYFDGELNFDYPNPKLLFHHGTLARKGAGNSAKSESETRGGINSASGHTHRLSVSYKRTLHGQVIQIEGGTLRTLNTDWMAFSDWTHGAVHIEYDLKNNYVSANPINIVNGVAYISGERI